MSFSIVSPRSTEIKDDFLIAYHSLAKIEPKLKTLLDGDEKLSNFIPKLTSIIESFNTNVKYINNQIQTLDSPKFPSFEDYCKNENIDLKANTEAKEKYDEAEMVFEFDQLQETYELSQLKQLGSISRGLTKTISRVYAQLEKFDSITGKLPLCELEKPNLPDSLLKTKLRLSEEPFQTIAIRKEIAATPVETTTSIRQLSSIPIDDFASESDLSLAASIANSTDSSDAEDTEITSIHTSSPCDATEISKLTPSIVITVICDLGKGQTLGICCDPNWADAPIVLTKHESCWSGQVPQGKEWKCVVLQEGRVVQWENGENRRCDSETEALHLNVNFG